MKRDISAIREKASLLPMCPGVYVMKDEKNEVIYVGKSKQLKSRVSQYFHPQAAHTPKTRMMASRVADFDVILTKTEFEALVLENSLIKRYKPRYNILLKDDKGYPYIRFTLSDRYPAMSIVSKPAKDGAKYFGPYYGRTAARNAISALSEALMLPTCGKKFPRDIGRERPCLNKHLGKCMAPCSGEVPQEEFMRACLEAEMLLSGKQGTLVKSLEDEMTRAAEELRFEYAAKLRDRLAAVKGLAERQSIVSSVFADTDVVAFSCNGSAGVIAVLRYVDGTLRERDIISADGFAEGDAPEVIGSFLAQYYGGGRCASPTVLVSAMPEDAETLEHFLSERAERTVHIFAPVRGDKRALVELALTNASDELKIRAERDRRSGKLSTMLGELLGLEKAPSRIEAYDISNTSGKNIVGGMVVFENTRPKRSAYRRFKIDDLEDQNDVGAMAEVIRRRLRRMSGGDEKFASAPDLILVDGGITQTSAAAAVLREEGFRNIPVYGMVKDDRHRTRALVRCDGHELGLTATPPVFAFVGRIQEEVHRYAIEYHRLLRGKTDISVLDGISGVGAARKKALLQKFKTIKAIRLASIEELSSVVPAGVAENIKNALNTEDTEQDMLNR